MNLYDVWAPSYDLLRRPFAWFTPKVHRALDQLLCRASDAEVLDLGSGTGFLVRRCIANGLIPRAYLGVDRSKGMLRLANRWLKHRPSQCVARLEQADVRQAVAGLLDRGDRFEVVMSSLLLAHIARPCQVVRQSVELVTPGGAALFVFFADDGHPVLRLPVRWFLWLLKAKPVNVASVLAALEAGAQTRTPAKFKIHQARSLFGALVFAGVEFLGPEIPP